MAYADIRTKNFVNTLEELHHYRVDWAPQQDDIVNIVYNVPMNVIQEEPLLSVAHKEHHEPQPREVVDVQPEISYLDYHPPKWVIPVPEPESEVSRDVTPTIESVPCLHPVIQDQFYTTDDRWEGSTAVSYNARRYDFDDAELEMFQGRYEISKADERQYIPPVDPFRMRMAEAQVESHEPSKTSPRHHRRISFGEFLDEDIVRAYPVPESWSSWTRQLLDDLGHSLKDSLSLKRLEQWSNELSVIEQVGEVSRGVELYRGTPATSRRSPSIQSEKMENFSVIHRDNEIVQHVLPETTRSIESIFVNREAKTTQTFPSPPLSASSSTRELTIPLSSGLQSPEIFMKSFVDAQTSPLFSPVIQSFAMETQTSRSLSPIVFKTTKLEMETQTIDPVVLEKKEMDIQKDAVGFLDLHSAELNTVVESRDLSLSSYEMESLKEMETAEENVQSGSEYDEHIEVIEIVEEQDEEGHTLGSTSRVIETRTEHHKGDSVLVTSEWHKTHGNDEQEHTELIKDLSNIHTSVSAQNNQAEGDSEKNVEGSEYDEIVEEIEVIEELDEQGNVLNTTSRRMGSHVEHHHQEHSSIHRHSVIGETTTEVTSSTIISTEAPKSNSATTTKSTEQILQASTQTQGQVQHDEDEEEEADEEYEEVVEEIEVTEEVDEYGNVISTSERSLGSHVEHHHRNISGESISLHPQHYQQTKQVKVPSDEDEEYDRYVEEIEVIEEVDEHGNVISSSSRNLGTTVEHLKRPKSKSGPTLTQDEQTEQVFTKVIEEHVMDAKGNMISSK